MFRHEALPKQNTICRWLAFEPGRAYHPPMTTPELQIDALWARVRPDAHGLAPCITQDLRTRAVLMVAWVSKEALAHALTCGFATYWSRSRQVIWEKGKSSGNHQRLIHVRLDCDGDTLLYVVEAKLPACHEGTDTCFSYRRVGNGWSREPVQIQGDLDSEVAQEFDTVLQLQVPGAPKRPRFQDLTRKLEASLETDDDAQVLGDSADLVASLGLALKARKLSLRQVFETLENQLGKD